MFNFREIEEFERKAQIDLTNILHEILDNPQVYRVSTVAVAPYSGREVVLRNLMEAVEGDDDDAGIWDSLRKEAKLSQKQTITALDDFGN